MGRHIDSEMTVMEEEVCYTRRCLETGGTDREVSQEAEVGRVGKNFYGGFHGRNRQGRETCLGSASLNNFSGCWAVPWWLVPGPGVMRAAGEWPRV